jgi:hypothetical protein
MEVNEILVVVVVVSFCFDEVGWPNAIGFSVAVPDDSPTSPEPILSCYPFSTSIHHLSPLSFNTLSSRDNSYFTMGGSVNPKTGQ